MAEKKDEHELLQALAETRAEIEKCELNLKALNAAEQEAELALIAFLDNADLKGFKSTLLNLSADKKEDLKVTIPEDKKEEAFTFIDEELGRGDAIKTVRNIHHKTLTSIIGNRFKEGALIPKDTFKVYWLKSIDIKPLK